MTDQAPAQPTGPSAEAIRQADSIRKRIDQDRALRRHLIQSGHIVPADATEGRK
jgi:hypothetical protein